MLFFCGLCHYIFSSYQKYMRHEYKGEEEISLSYRYTKWQSNSAQFLPLNYNQQRELCTKIAIGAIGISNVHQVYMDTAPNTVDNLSSKPLYVQTIVGHGNTFSAAFRMHLLDWNNVIILFGYNLYTT